MARVELRSLHHHYGDHPAPDGFAIRDLNLVWGDGTANALLGPSGCGKTTLLNILSGLIQPVSGSVLFDEVEVNDLKPSDRHVAQVFQFPIVYDTMTVFENLAFPLRNRHIPENQVGARVRDIAELLELERLLNIRSGRLSAAEKQVVALGRGLVRKDTAAVLLDEPLTVIDPLQTLELRRKLRQVQQELRITMIYVTHDQHEALTFADDVTIMNHGAVVQTASPAELFLNPETPFVGHFIGSPGMNLFNCQVLESRVFAEKTPLQLPEDTVQRLGNLSGAVQLGIRPEFVQTSPGRRRGWNVFQVVDADHMGAFQILTLQAGSLRLRARVDDQFSVSQEGEVWVQFPADKVRLYRDGALVKPGLGDQYPR